MYRRLRARRGHKRALVAVAHALLTAIWHLLGRGTEYADPAAAGHPRQPDPERLTRHLVQRLQQLGYAVSLEPAA